MTLAVCGKFNTNTGKTSTGSLYSRIDLINIFDSVLLLVLHYVSVFVLIFETKGYDACSLPSASDL